MALPEETRTSHTLPDGLSVQLETEYDDHDEAASHCFVLNHELYAPGRTRNSPRTSVASAKSFIIHKDRIVREDDWQEAMGEYSDQTIALSEQLFDRWARLRSEWIRSPEKKGTGVWGHELDRGSILFIDEMRVDQEYRARGIGSWLLQQILTSRYATSCAFAYAWPSPLYPGGRPLAELASMEQIATKMYANAGFRRVGRSDFVCYALSDANHASHRLAASDDAEPLDSHTIQARPLAQLPIHAALRDRTELDVVLDLIRTHHRAEPSSIRVKDAYGGTPLHFAAHHARFAVISELLNLGAHDDVHEKDTKGSTPLSCLERTMRTRRDESMPWGSFKGQKDEACQCQILLMTSMGLSPPSLEMMKWGCTCGQCTDGWLSPRMRLRLQGMSYPAFLLF